MILVHEGLIFFVENKIMVEIKAVINLEDVHLAQAMNYVEAYNLEIGLLINFGAKSLQHKRVHNNKLIKKSSNQDIPSKIKVQTVEMIANLKNRDGDE